MFVPSCLPALSDNLQFFCLEPSLPAPTTFSRVVSSRDTCFYARPNVSLQVMPTNAQESPRAKIRQWLSETESKVNLNSSIQDHSQCSKNGKTALLEPKHPIHQADFSPQIRVKTDREHHYYRASPATQGTHHQHSACSIEPQPEEEPGIISKYLEHRAEDPSGLQGHCRAYGQDAQLAVETTRPRKRQRTTQPASSGSERASSAGLDRITRDHGAGHSGHIQPAKRNSVYSDVSKQSAIFFSSPKQAPITYERRRRHKTREDHYDIKHSIARQGKTAVRSRKGGRSAKTRRHKEKSGRALMQDFTAPNVPSERLTVGAPCRDCWRRDKIDTMCS